MDCTADDGAVVTILKDIDLGGSNQVIYSGVFTIDLNGCEISCTGYGWSVLHIDEAGANVTIADSGEDGILTVN